MSAEVALVYRVLPESVEVDVEKLKTSGRQQTTHARLKTKLRHVRIR